MIERMQQRTAWVLLLVPTLIFFGIGAALLIAGDLVIGRYLLQLPPWKMDHGLEFLLDGFFALVCAFFLRPVFRAQQRYYECRKAGQPFADAALLQTCRNRIFNYPLVLIAATYLCWTINISVFYFMNRDTAPLGPVIAIGLITSVINAVLCYYATETLTRFYLIPHWFPDGKITVTRRLMRKPSLMQRFVDLFMVNAFLPAISVAGIIFLARNYGPGDAGLMERVFYTTIAISLAYWTFGFPLAIVTASTIITPVEELARAAEKISREDYSINLAVHSDDQIGRLQVTMNQVSRELQEKAKIKTLFGHYVSPVVRDMILSGKIRTDGEKVEAVVLFSDIRSFTSLTESHPAEKIVEMLNIHFSRMVTAISDNQGFVDKFIGDAVMAVFDAEFCSQRHRAFAFNAVSQILQGMRETNRQMQNLGLPKIDIGLGMACGEVIRGNIGAPERKELTVIGDTVNLAARLEALTKSVGRTVVASRNSIDLDLSAWPGIELSSVEPIPVRGKSQPVDVVAFSLAGELASRITGV